MKYLTLTMLFFAFFMYTMGLSDEDSKQEEDQAQDVETYEVDWDKAVREIESDANAHDSWSY